MNRPCRQLAAAFVFLALTRATPAPAADTYTLDPMHSSVSFKISHLGLSWVHGRFNEVSGAFTIDPDNAANCSFALTIKTDSVDTNNKLRDTHLRKADFFNAVQFPTIAFQSTALKQIKDGYEVTGDLTMHGVTKPVTFTLVGGRKAEFPKNVQRTGYSTELILKRSDFGVGPENLAKALGDDVLVSVSFEGVKK